MSVPISVDSVPPPALPVNWPWLVILVVLVVLAMILSVLSDMYGRDWR